MFHGRYYEVSLEGDAPFINTPSVHDARTAWMRLWVALVLSTIGGAGM
jgi:hypothetical protein